MTTAPAARRPTAIPLLVAVVVALLLVAARPAVAADTTTTVTATTGTTTTPPVTTVTRAGSTDPNGTETPASMDEPPLGHRLSAKQAQEIARRDPKLRRVQREHPGSYDQIMLKGKDRWQLSLYARRQKGKPLKELAQVLISDQTARITESWDGPYVAWTMARGYDGAFGRSVTSPWLWGVMLVLFLVPFVGFRPRRGPPLALLALAAFTVPLAAFNNARLDLAVPTSFALLLALAAWALWRGLRQPGPPRDLVIGLPLVGLLLLGVALLVFRIVLNLTDGNVIDVGYAGVVGADHIGHGQPVYGAFPKGIEAGDTYGPLNYLLYVPFEQLWPWSGRWDDLPAAHGAAIAFDLLATAALFAVGRRQERDRDAGRARGALYAYLWLACPWSLYCLNSNANDAAVAAALALLLAIGAQPLGRGVAAGIAAATKITPLALFPLLATRRAVAPHVRVEHGWPRWRSLGPAWFGLGALLVLGITTLWVLHGDPLRLLYERTVEYQAEREAPFTPWGFYDLPQAFRDVARVLAVLLGIALAFVPRRHDVTGTALLMAAVLLGLQMAAEYWFYLYLTWLLPLVLVGALGDRRLRWPISRRPAVTPRVLGPLPEEDAPWAAAARADDGPPPPAG
ncbi:glycosyltransferase 87 family protein [Patulibacter defluvii]|uniref:glycosyltransferase 87 family protein n=1 Tax=Patulibacter defluvii TaxID=3095358 RepID=UPI002A762820|nr:glycosyltransferase 87 family protein [Patulibacter sp. DM4]